MTATTTPDATAPVRLVVGLGNPGSRYERTRHNAGQRVVEALAARLGAGRMVDRYAGRFTEVRGPSGPLALLIPTTFMNDSGRSVGPAAGQLRAAPDQVLVVHDEVDLPFGVVRGKRGGGPGGHNGLRSLDVALGSRDYLRVRLGVGRPDPAFRGDTAAWVLAAFSEPASEVDELLGAGLAMVESALEHGFDAAIATHHASPPGARAKARAERREAGTTTTDDGSE
ncbi:MAG: aminoacyl-tRNA hydrolase [Actinobacteria bacterium]|nr:aminoacyl-tRNA hydrolase [Actinomycetota bacterium]